MKKRRQREQIGWRGYWRSGLIGKISSKKRIQMEMNFVMMKKLVITIAMVMLMDAWQIITSSLEKKVEAAAIKEKLDQDLHVLSLTKIQFGGDQGLRAEDYSPIICLQYYCFSSMFCPIMCKRIFIMLLRVTTYTHCFVIWVKQDEALSNNM